MKTEIKLQMDLNHAWQVDEDQKGKKNVWESSQEKWRG